MRLPTLSIVTPSFNQAAFLEKTIRSVLDQDYPDLEYRIMDGGSTDGSVEIIRRYETKLAGWQSKPDGGQAAALRQGFSACNGEILAWINSDDYYLPGVFKSIGEAFTLHPEIELIYGDIVMVDATDHPLTLDVLPRFNMEDLKRVCMIPQQAAFWRKSAYDDVGGVDPSFQFCMDYDLFLRLARRGKVLHIPRLLAAFRQHPEAKTSARKAIWDKEEALLRKSYLGHAAWNAHDWLRMKWLTIRQIAAIAARRIAGESFPCLTPARWARLARRKLAPARYPD
ncbi:glycosyltransferase [Candidatus Sumerlaeota bacterium]|nr:glycosyltransferase [Candidatus Sumerlaeota bacterium]MBI3736438.1 glycosyltransferase [Candidatus Sumerlaeota bacterium]